MRIPMLAIGWALLATPAVAVAQVTAELAVAGLSNPVAFVADPDVPDAYLIVEQDGLVRVLREGQLLGTPFLDLRGSVLSGGERGLLGLAFEPHRTDGATAPGRRVFVNFTNRSGDTVIARVRRTADNPLVADAASRHDLVWPDGRSWIEQPFSNHNGGHLAFGPDGYLYIGLGDGGSGGDPMHRAQDPDALLGKMLRIDVAVPDTDPRGYRVPDDNPFVDGDPLRALGEIWAFGLRNPWRYSFDDPARGGTGALIIGDVGQGAREEVDYQPPGRGGLNFGWRLREGTLGFDDRRPAAYEPLTPPIHEYPRSDGQAITGGFVYRGAALDPSWRGRYFFADFASGRVFTLGWPSPGDSGIPTSTDLREHTAALGGRERLGLISSFGVDLSGELYLLNHERGEVWKIAPDLGRLPAAPRNLRVAAEGDEVRLSWTASSEGVSADSFLIETTGADGLRPLRSVPARDARGARLTLDADERCLRVRGIGRNGAGPPSALTCVAAPNASSF